MIQVVKYKCCGVAFAACCAPECYTDDEWISNLKEYVQRGDIVEMVDSDNIKLSRCTCKSIKGKKTAVEWFYEQLGDMINGRCFWGDKWHSLEETFEKALEMEKSQEEILDARSEELYKFSDSLNQSRLNIKRIQEKALSVIENQKQMLTDLVKDLMAYTREANKILGHDERDASEFVEIFLEKYKK